MKKVLLAALVLLIVGVVPAFAQKATPPAGLTLGQAINIGKSNAPEGSTLLMARIEGGPMFGMYFWYNGRILEIEIRGPKDIVKIEELKDDGPFDKDFMKKVVAVKAKSKIPLARFLEIAKEKGGGDPTGYRLQPNGDSLTAAITVGDTTVNIDINTGRVLD
jgi:hypothetical protein